jgi:hypothetical protein
MTTFVAGLEVYYNGMYGVIRHVDDQYITVCTKLGYHKSKDVCIVVYRDRYELITLKTESEK